jgi:phytoene/squalene synthetase
LQQFTAKEKRQIELEIEGDFKIALEGIKKLPSSSKGGVYLAYVYYRSLLKKIKRLPADRVLTERVRISNGSKIRLMINSLVQYKMNLV